jgi:O-antigen/teichoic acid export membrane protein
MIRLHGAKADLSRDGLGPYLVRSVIGSGAVQLAGILATFFVGVLLARGLGATGYGYYGIAMAVIMLAAMPGSFGIPKLVTREIAAAQTFEDIGALFGVLRWADRTCRRISAAIAIVLAIGALISLQNGRSELGLAILLGAPAVALLPLSEVRSAALRGLHKVVLGQLSNVLIRPLVLSIMIFAIILAGLQLTAPIVMALNSLVAGFTLLLSAYWLRRSLPRHRPSASTLNTSGWLGSSIPIALTDTVQILQLQAAVLLLGILALPAEVGLFRVSISTASMVAVPVSVVNLVVLPMFSRLHTEGDRTTLQRLVTSSACIQFAGVFLLALPLVVATGPLLEIVFGTSYVGAANTIRILAIGVILSSAFGPNAQLLNMTGHERRVTRAVAVALFVNVIVVAFLAAKWGSEGTAIGVFAGQLCWNVLLWLDAKRLLRIETSVRFPMHFWRSQQ